jgi:hypothetical protein
MIKTSAGNSWHDRSIQDVLAKLTERLGARVLLRYRSARRIIFDDGMISSGTLSGAEQGERRTESQVTLWIMDVTPVDSVIAPFMFPMIVVPNRRPLVFVFSKK